MKNESCCTFKKSRKNSAKLWQILENLRTKTRCLDENEEKHGKKENPERKKENKREALRASLNYAEELGPLLFLGRRSETGAGWLSDAGEYCGDTGEDCDAGALLNCEYGGDTGENCEAGVGSNCEPVETAEPTLLV